MNRNQWILAGLLVAQVLLLLLTRGPMAGTDAAAEAEALFPTLESFTAAKLVIEGGEDEKIILERQGEGWGLAEFDGYPADGTKVDELLTKLKELEVRRPVVTSSRYHGALKVTDAEHEGRVKIWKDAAGSPEVDFFLGTAPNYQRVHVRRQDDDRVFEAQGLGAYDVQARAPSWFDNSFIDVPVSQVTSIRLENASGAFEIARAEDGTWSVSAPSSSQGLELDTDKVETLVRLVGSLRVVEPVGKRDDAAHGLDAPRVSVLLRHSAPAGDVGTAEPEESVLWVGDALSDDDTRVYVARSGFDFVAQVYKTSVDKLLEQKLSELEAGDDPS